MTADETYYALVADLSEREEIGSGRMFRSTGLTYKGKFFVARRPSGDLLLKLPEARVDALVEAKVGQPFDRGDGRILREWVVVPASEADAWTSLAEEALQFAHALHA